MCKLVIGVWKEGKVLDRLSFEPAGDALCVSFDSSAPIAEMPIFFDRLGYFEALNFQHIAGFWLSHVTLCFWYWSFFIQTRKVWMTFFVFSEVRSLYKKYYFFFLYSSISSSLIRPSFVSPSYLPFCQVTWWIYLSSKTPRVQVRGSRGATFLMTVLCVFVLF